MRRLHARARLALGDERADVLGGREQRHRDERLLERDHRQRVGGGAAGERAEVARNRLGREDRQLRAVTHRGAQRHRRRRHDDLDVVLLLEPLLHDLEVEHAEEAAAQPAAERVRVVGLDRHRAVL